MKRYRKEKLLFMGCSTGSMEALQYAKDLGVYTIVTDYYSPKENILKGQADAYWMIDVADTDALEERCKKERITGVFAATSEFCLDQTRELCRRLGLPFYASDEGWKCARDKRRFKNLCIECGLNVPKEYELDSECIREQAENINYPVIVKPIDACAQQGLSLCSKKKELLEGYQKALDKSPSKKVLVEEYILGNEIDAFYFVVDGEPLLLQVSDKYFMMINERQNASYQPAPSRFYDEYKEKLGKKVKRLFEQMHCRWGACFLQAIQRDGKYYFLEFGYRIDGIGSWVNTKPQYGYSNVELMVDLALGRKLSVDLKTEVTFSDKNNATYLFWARPGKIEKIRGLDEVKRMDGVSVVVSRFHEGDVIPKADSMLQMAYYIGIIGDCQEELLGKLERINAILHIYDSKGEDLMLPYQKYDEVRKNILNNQ